MPCNRCRSHAKPTPEQIEFFEKKVRPLLADNCYSCHGAEKTERRTATGYRRRGSKLESRVLGILVAGEPAKSKLIQAVKREGDFPMPPESPLPAETVATLSGMGQSRSRGIPMIFQYRSPIHETLWLFQAIEHLQSRIITRSKISIVNPIDAFVAENLRDKGLLPLSDSSSRTLIRRAYFDLIGFPPIAAEVDAFEKDNDPRPAGKRSTGSWPRLPMGNAGAVLARSRRYADTKGYASTKTGTIPYAYTYRDYVVRSLNEDKPYDRFILEQRRRIVPSPSRAKTRNHSLLSAFSTLGRRFSTTSRTSSTIASMWRCAA